MPVHPMAADNCHGTRFMARAKAAMGIEIILRYERADTKNTASLYKKHCFFRPSAVQDDLAHKSLWKND